MARFMVNGEQITESNPIHFPITPVGEKSIVKMLVENDSVVDDIELIPFIEDNEVTIDYKRTLKPTESMLATFTFSPNRERKHSLNTPIGFKELIG